MVAEDLSHGTRQQAVSAVAFLPAEAQILVWGPPAYVTGPSGAIGIPRSMRCKPQPAPHATRSSKSRVNGSLIISGPLNTNRINNLNHHSGSLRASCESNSLRWALLCLNRKSFAILSTVTFEFRGSHAVPCNHVTSREAMRPSNRLLGLATERELRP